MPEMISFPLWSLFQDCLMFSTVKDLWDLYFCNLREQWGTEVPTFRPCALWDTSSPSSWVLHGAPPAQIQGTKMTAWAQQSSRSWSRPIKWGNLGWKGPYRRPVPAPCHRQGPLSLARLLCSRGPPLPPSAKGPLYGDELSFAAKGGRLYCERLGFNPWQFIRRNVICWLLLFLKDTHQLNAILEMANPSPYKPFSLHRNTTTAPQKICQEPRRQEFGHLGSPFSRHLPRVSPGCHPAQRLSHTAIPSGRGLEPRAHGGSGWAAGGGRRRHRTPASPTQMQSRAPRAREVCSLVRFNIKMWQAPYIQEDKWYAKSILFVLTSVQRENSWDKAVAFQGTRVGWAEWRFYQRSWALKH